MNSVPSSGPSHLRTVLLLFVLMRISILFLYVPRGPLNVYSDFFYYYNTARLSEQGYYPFVNMWYEYPPLLAYLPQGVYALTRLAMPPGGVDSFTYVVFSWLMGLALLPFEGGTVLLLHRTAEQVWGTAQANWAAWVYSSLSLPLYYWSFSHQALVSCLVLLAVYRFLRGHYGRSALAVGLGIATKLIPVFLLAPAAKFLWPRRGHIIRYVGVAALPLAASCIPFIALGGGQWLAASFVALSRIASWNTIWALLDGNWRGGYYGPLEARLDLSLAHVTYGNPPVVPLWLVFAGFGLWYAWLFFRLAGRDERHFVWFTTLTALVFHLWSKGWSPQWAVTLMPLFLLSFPGRAGLVLCLVLTGIVWVEWPLASAFESNTLLAVSVLARTGLFVGAAWALGKRLYGAARRSGSGAAV